MRNARRSTHVGVLVQRLLALGALGWMVFDFPLLLLWSSNAVVVFVWWAIVIALLAWLMERGDGELAPANDTPVANGLDGSAASETAARGATSPRRTE